MRVLPEILRIVVQLQTIRCLEYTVYSELWTDQYQYWKSLSQHLALGGVQICLASKVYTAEIQHCDWLVGLQIS